MNIDEKNGNEMNLIHVLALFCLINVIYFIAVNYKNLKLYCRPFETC